MKKILLLGYTGKVGTAIMESFQSDDYLLVGLNSKDFDARDINSIRKYIQSEKPDIVINCVAKLGMNPCEDNPMEAFTMNSLYPRELAKLSNEFDFLLVHFSTDAMLDNSEGYIDESVCPKPMNAYGLTKFGGDCFIEHTAKRYYIIRISLLFGEVIKAFKDNTQFVENIFYRLENGETKLRIADDVVFSPTYSLDVARKLREIIENEYDYGIYHVVNEGEVSLYDFTKAFIDELYPNVSIERTKIKEFYSEVKRNTYYPMTSKKIGAMRPWNEAIKEYCDRMKKNEV